MANDRRDEIEYINDLFEEDLELTPYHFGKTYTEFEIESIDGEIPPHKLTVSYYYDLYSLPIDSPSRIGYAGKLTIHDWGDRDNPNRYQALATGDQPFQTEDNPGGGNHDDDPIEGIDQISIRDLLAWAYMCTYPNGNHVNYAVNDEDESYDLADEALGYFEEE